MANTKKLCGRSYPHARIWGGCTIRGELESNPCNSIKALVPADAKANGLSYAMIFGETGPDGPCFPGFSYRVCVQDGWDRRNKNKCCSGELDDIASCDPKWCPGSSVCPSTTPPTPPTPPPTPPPPPTPIQPPPMPAPTFSTEAYVIAGLGLAFILLTIFFLLFYSKQNK